MAEQNPKRPREEEIKNSDDEDFHKEEQDVKRLKSYDHILSILEEEEDFSDIFTDLQQELISDESDIAGDVLLVHDITSPESYSGQNSCSPDEEDNKLRMMKHLLEASDDELGIPNRVESSDEGADGGGDGGGCGGGGGGEQLGYLYDGLWEFEDEAANYYTLLQSELFL